MAVQSEDKALKTTTNGNESNQEPQAMTIKKSKLDKEEEEEQMIVDEEKGKQEEEEDNQDVEENKKDEDKKQQQQEDDDESSEKEDELDNANLLSTNVGKKSFLGNTCSVRTLIDDNVLIPSDNALSFEFMVCSLLLCAIVISKIYLFII